VGSRRGPKGRGCFSRRATRSSFRTVDARLLIDDARASHVRTAESRMTVMPVTPSRFVYRWSGLALKQVIITTGFTGSNAHANGINYVYGSVPVTQGGISSPTPQKPGFLIVTEIVGRTASRGSHSYRQHGASHFDSNLATRNLNLLIVSNLPPAIVRRIGWAILR